MGKEDGYWFQKEVCGVTTVELAYLMPIIFLAFILTVYTTFYYHDKCIILGAASETAVLGAQLQRKPDEVGQTDLDAFFQERISGKLIFFPGAQAEINLSENWIEVQAFAGYRGMKLAVVQNAAIVKPERLIRIKRIGENFIEGSQTDDAQAAIQE